jgi:membrane protein
VPNTPEPGRAATDGRADRPDRPDGAHSAHSVPDSPTSIPAGGWKAILRRSIQQFKHDDVTDRAAALTYFGVLAIFPGLLVLVSIMGMLGRSNVQSLLNNLEQVAPGGVSSFLHTALTQVQGRGGAATIGAIVGVVIALWSASGYIAAFMRASNAIYDVDEGRPIWRTAPVRLGVTVAVVVMLVACSLIVVITGSVAQQVGDMLGVGNGLVLLWQIAKWPVLLVIVSMMFSLLYWACPNVKQPGFKWITPGGVLAVVVWLMASGLFALYVSFSSSYNKTYGSLAAIIIFLVWLWISNIAILLGVEFNAESQRQRLVEAGMPADVEPFVDVRDSAKLDDAEKDRVEEAGRVRRAHVQS